MLEEEKTEIHCSSNAFCDSLDEDKRQRLCANCRRRFVKAGSLQFYEDFERNASLLIDGIVLISGYIGREVVGLSNETPTCYLGVPGRVLSTNVTFRESGGTEEYGYNSMEYLTDCCVAHFDHSVIRELFEQSGEFARSMMLSALRIMEDGCMMTAILRAPSIYLSVYYLIQYLEQQHAYLNQQQIAALLCHDRTSIAKAVAQIRRDQPGMWDAYVANKGRAIVMTHPKV